MIADEFRLSPIQEGMLFHHLSGNKPGVDIEQIVIGYQEPLDAALLEQAWRLATQRHSVLRTSFDWAQSPDPLQQVHDPVALSLDVRQVDENEADFKQFLTRDRASGFDLSQAPLMRLTLLDYGQHRYRLVWTVHHILLDGRAFILVLNDVEEFYRRLRLGETVVPEPGPSFRPYIEWLKGINLEGADRFWGDRLKGFAGPTPLPFDAAAPGGTFSDYGTEELRLSEETTSVLRKLATRLDVTLNTVVMGVWGFLLSRYCGEQQVLFGATKTTRRGSIPGADSVVGQFLNTVPVRADFPPDMPFSAALQQLRAEWLSIRAFEHTPLTRIKEASGFASAASLFDSLIVFENQNFHSALADTAECWKTREWRLLEQTNFPLTFAVFGDPEMLLKLEFDRLRFTDETAQRMLRHARQLFEGIASDTEQKIGEMALLTAPERHQLLVEWNSTERAYPQETSVARLVEAQVEKTPDAIAVVCGEQRLTYRELNQRANQLAHRLLRHGVQAQEKVGIAIERSPELIAGILAILKAGAAYVPIDLAYPLERRDFMLQDCGIRFLLTVPSGKPVDTRREVEIIDASFESAGDISGDTENPASRADLASPAYVMYTSGSTGRPKGVEIPHRGIVRLLVGSEYAEMTGNQVFLQLATVSFDASTFEIWGALIHGARLVLSQGDAFDMAKLGDEIARHGVTTLWLTTSLFNAVVDVNPGILAPVRQLLIGGEALSVQHVVRALKALPNTEIINGYGPTESTTFATCYPIPRDLAPNSNSIPIGRPIANTRLYILDPHLQPVPIGVAGELYIGGDGLARGYVNLPDLTKERFIADPFAPNERIYKTGDLVRYLPDGNIEFLGRRDDQVKIRGFRIELGEIETRLAEHPAVREAAVIAREDTPGDKRIVAYYTSAHVDEAQPGSDGAERLRSHLSAVLPEYMVPAAYVRLESWPLTPNGKLDRKALPAVNTAACSTRSHEPPRGEAEVKIAAIWAEVLKVDRVGRNDNFFDLGGHSLMAARAVALMNRDFGTSLPIRVLFQANTVSQLAQLIDKQGAGQEDDWPLLIPIQPNGTRPPLFCVARPNVNALVYLFLSRELGSNQPVYGLQVQLEEDPAIDFSDEQIRSTAAEYIRAMKTVQPHGPYNLIGQCQGAYIAFEMVRQLEAAGDKASFLGVLDAWTEENTRHRWRFKADLAIKRMLKYDPAAHLRPSGPKRPDGPALSPEAATGSTKKALFKKYFPGKDFVPPVCSAPITVFRARKQPWYRKNDEKMGWGDRTRSDVTIRLIPVCHTKILRKPYVEGLAASIAERLDEVIRNGH